ncbi:uncharacterized protein Z520_11317 [Fonsecaea multimorphosa CBS 102226]|uniref:BZIP domain-containing protein n=1 Tax=Fonsecaea multimorphosa CBS 102226 TaxID=1442371 RepID=A0A0D2JRG7_9EURO|nr:uncharacterized protein Z520_11317 [Fonsecaea multimorphosa CBS 102226]KIX93044.1 hypothetical protein Z520_11317 [Fonsecaea multimorphosa CBS 102226]OAL18291.1 hypothetical protein AYO22_10869 [Fonsecaea multimorphosa]
MPQDQQPTWIAATSMNQTRHSDNQVSQHYMPSPCQVMEGFSHLSVKDGNPNPTLIDRHASQTSISSVPSLDSEYVSDNNWQSSSSLQMPCLQDAAWWFEPFGDVHDPPPDADLYLGSGESSQLESPLGALGGSEPSKDQVDARLDRRRERRREQNRQAQRRHRERRQLNYCLTQGKVVELQAALATALEQQKLVKQENSHLRGRLVSLEAEVDCLRRSMSPATFETTGFETPSEFELGT